MSIRGHIYLLTQYFIFRLNNKTRYIFGLRNTAMYVYAKALLSITSIILLMGLVFTFYLIKLSLLFFIILLFVIKPLTISFYQQKSGDYFNNRLLYWYSKGEISSSIPYQRKKAMILANRLNTVLWGISILLLIIIIGERFYMNLYSHPHRWPFIQPSLLKSFF